MSKSITASSLAAAVVVSGCGLHVPDMQPFYKSETHERADENVIVNQISCELKKGVYEALVQYATNGHDISWLKGWGAKITLTLAVDEKGGLAPGVSLTTPFENDVKHFPTGPVTLQQSFALGLGVQGTADAVRKETITYTYSFKDFHIDPTAADFQKPKEKCDNEDGFFINSNLKIPEFINSKVFLAWTKDSAAPTLADGHSPSGDPQSPFSAFSDEIVFNVSYGGSITPTWKFVAFTVSTNSAGPLVSAARTSTQDVLITMARVQSKPGEPPSLASAAEQQHNAQLTGLFFSNGILSQ